MSQADPASTTGVGEFDLQEWLTQNKLGKVAAEICRKFEELECTLDEVSTFSQDEFENFMKEELNLSTLNRKRFGKAIESLKVSNYKQAAVILSEKENIILDTFQTKWYVILLLLMLLSLHTKQKKKELKHKPATN